MAMSRLIVALILFGAAGPARADGSGKWQGPAEIYRQVCTYCHDAGVSPVILGRQIPAEVTRMIVRHGQNGMPAFRESEISDAELEAVAAWLNKSETPR